MENYYKILEIDQNASQEIVEKAYKTLVKKYHPDLKKGPEKIEAENKIKQINLAYDTLSDETKRKNYNANLKEKYISISQYNSLLQENINLKKQLNNIRNTKSNFKDPFTRSPNSYNINQTQRVYYKPPKNSYYNTNYYSQYTENTNKSKGILKKIIKGIFNILIIAALFILIMQLPFLQDIIYYLFDGNFIFILIMIIFFYIYFFQKNK